MRVKNLLLAPNFANTDGAPPVRGAAPGSSFRLLRYFSITAGVAILLVAIALSWTYYRKEVNDQVEAAEARSVVVAQTFANAIWPQFETHILGKFGNAQQIQAHANTQKLHEMITSLAHKVPVSKVKIYNPSGVAIYSSERNEIGEDDSRNPAFQLAHSGRAVSEFTRRGERSGSEGEIAASDIVSTYIPISGDKGEIRAVFELYSDVTDGLLRIRQATLRLLFGLVSIFAALYAILLLIVAAADRILRRQYRELKASEAQIHAKNRALESEIEARRAVEFALRKSEEAAATANQAKSEFLSNMSHELRTPMNAILGFAQLLLSEPSAPLGTNQWRFVEEILKAGRHLLALINEVLDLARIEAGKIVLSVEPVAIGSVVGECLPLIQNMARDMNVQVKTPGAGAGQNVMADYMRLKQVLLNLLSNAVKYNRVGGTVTISTGPGAPGRTRISVSDTGTGIPESAQGELFRPFQRLGQAPLIVEGTGIGLALTKNLVIAMGGEIGFVSTAETGTTFWVEFLLAADAPAVPAAAGDGKLEIEGDGRAQGCVLYVEDNPANVLLMEQIAKRMSIRFITAHNAELGIVLAASEKPDLIIMDINLPQMDGYEALACLKQNPATASIPVMALSANAMQKDIERGLAAGFVRYHTKPIEVDDIARSIAQILRAPK